MGLVYLVVGALGFLAPVLSGLGPAGSTFADNLLHLAIGLLALVAVWLAALTAGGRNSGS